MRCPKCESRDTKKVSVRDPAWKMGGQKCQVCGHQAHWMNFCSAELAEVPPKPGDSVVSSLDGVEP